MESMGQDSPALKLKETFLNLLPLNMVYHLIVTVKWFVGNGRRLFFKKKKK